MSRGLGTMQRRILDTLQTAKDECRSYHGVGQCWFDAAPWVQYRGARVLLAEGVFDLRASSRYLARRHGIAHLEGAFQASFGRSVHSLIRRGLLVAPVLVPIVNYDRLAATDAVQCLSDGTYLVVTLQRICFVVQGPALRGSGRNTVLRPADAV